jgi:hypothetical protein
MFSKVSTGRYGHHIVVSGLQLAPRRLDGKIYGEHREIMYLRLKRGKCHTKEVVGCSLNRTRHKSREENVTLADNFTSSFIVFLSSIGSSAYVGNSC